MKIKLLLQIFLLSIFLNSCKAQKSSVKLEDLAVNDSIFVNIKDYSSNFVFDMKYATDDNFLKTKVYECGECFLRFKTVKSLIEANEDFIRKGYKIKLFDCYRPLDVQKKMWSIVSDPNYVANPSKGSIHNRGGAVDITLIDENGVELDMGTKFDHFGPESAHDYKEFAKEILKNRKLLKKIMMRNDFESFDSEWWHYNLDGSRKDKLSNFTWKCN